MNTATSPELRQRAVRLPSLGSACLVELVRVQVAGRANGACGGMGEGSGAGSLAVAVDQTVALRHGEK